LLAIYWKDSDSKIKRELALILIAVAAGLKIYPAIFGLLYVKEKRWKETVRLVLYGLTVFFAPFVFAGGLTGFLAYLNDLRAFQGIYGIRWTSIGNYGYALINALGIDTAVVSSGCMKVVEIVYFLLLLTVFFITKEKWKAVFYLSAVITTFVPNSWRYVAVYMVIALTAYFAEINGNSKRNLIYSILFSICFSIPWYGYFMNLDADFCIFTAIYVCIAVSFGEEIGSMCRRIMKRDRILRN
jgi:hypothetical protein